MTHAHVHPATPTAKRKRVKGVLALAAGTVLLMGGGGTLALWNDSADIAAGDISTGVLSIDTAPGSWTPDIDLWVPGDRVTYTTDVSVVAQGDNLAAQLTIDEGSLTGDPELLDALDITVTLGAATGGTFVPRGGNVFDVVPTDPRSATPVEAPVTVVIDFPADSVTGSTASLQSVDLSDLKLVLQQIAH